MAYRIKAGYLGALQGAGPWTFAVLRGADIVHCATRSWKLARELEAKGKCAIVLLGSWSDGVFDATHSSTREAV
jgi:hypothetical protein